MTEEKINFLLSHNPGDKGKEIVKCRSLEELTYAIAYMTLEAQHQGLGSCIIGRHR